LPTPYKPNVVTALTRLRIAAGLEGISYLVLLGIAMPLKYLAGRPEAVQVVGWIHGALFVLFLITLGHVWRLARWPYDRVAGALAAGVIPFGTFVLDRCLRRDVAHAQTGEH
jgi:integral membrane protein